eukprot:Tamp_32255.p1 GENE.Tamp_32255~~Tamp_32255.p1  ORF type:complete len:133 (+),score=23.62 Tamp_32255:26-424(+)
MVAGTGPITRMLTSDPRAAQIVKYGGVVYITGQVGNKDTLVHHDITKQTAETLAKVDALLAAAGTNKSHLLEGRIWLRDMRDFAGMNKIWNEWIDADNKPTRVCVESNMASPHMLVEIQVTAAEAALPTSKL